MLALRGVITSDLRFKAKDRSAYYAWVEQLYLAELDHQQAELYTQRTDIAADIARLTELTQSLESEKAGILAVLAKHDSSYARAKRRYFDYLFKHDREQWVVLDPVISVHPDATLFEGFSLDESSYGRVTLPADSLEMRETPCYGTTNIDFSESLAKAFERVRSYRPAVLEIGADRVAAGTASDMAIEKKIDLPPSWVRGFLQVQSASAMRGITVYLSADTVARVVAVLRRRRERRGPRSIRFHLRYGEKPRITIDPWGIEIGEWQHVYDGAESAEICIWGRRRLLCLERLLPQAENVEVRLLGSGLPSFWSIELDGHRFDLGISGWTSHDWASQARFATLTSHSCGDSKLLSRASAALERDLVFDVAGLGDALRISRNQALAALQQLCRQGDAMFDFRRNAYRWRQLFRTSEPSPLSDFQNDIDDATDLIKSCCVELVSQPKPSSRGCTQYACAVKVRKIFHPILDIDSDGRVATATCTCSFYRSNKLRRGPCPHMLAAVGFLSESCDVRGGGESSE